MGYHVEILGHTDPFMTMKRIPEECEVIVSKKRHFDVLAYRDNSVLAERKINSRPRQNRNID